MAQHPGALLGEIDAELVAKKREREELARLILEIEALPPPTTIPVGMQAAATTAGAKNAGARGGARKKGKG
jgi:hypothetical protein